MPREPPLPQAFASRNLLGVVVPDPGVPGRREGGWSFSAPIPREGPRGLTLRVAGAAGLTQGDAARGARAPAVLSRLWSAGGGDGADSGAGECGRGGGRERGPARAGLVPGPPHPQRPPRGRLCVLFPLVPGAVTPISVRGDLREPGGEGRGRPCGERRGGARGAGPWEAARPRAGPPEALSAAARPAPAVAAVGPEPGAAGVSEGGAEPVSSPAQLSAAPSPPLPSSPPAAFLELPHSCTEAAGGRTGCKCGARLGTSKKGREDDGLAQLASVFGTLRPGREAVCACWQCAWGPWFVWVPSRENGAWHCLAR